MRVYVLSSREDLCTLCRSIVDERRVHVERIDEVAQAASADDTLVPARPALLIDADWLAENLSRLDRAGVHRFVGVAVVCRDGEQARELEPQLGGLPLECLVLASPRSLACRISDWLGLTSLSREAEVQSRQIRDIAIALEASSQDMTVLRQKISFLDRQREKLSRVLETMNMLSRLSQEINCLDLDEIISICVTKLPLLVNARYASFYLHNYEQRMLELKRHNHGYRIDEVVRIGDDTHSVMHRALSERRIILIRDFDEYEKIHNMAVERPNSKNYSSRSCIIAPMLAGDRVVAVLNLADKRNGTFFDEVNDLPPLEQISVLVGTAIRNWQLFQEVRTQAKTDAMTSFINHQTFFDELEKEVLRTRRYQGPLSVLMIDVDNFKMFNDVYGHQLGDEILAEVARIIRQNIRDTDTPARYGGDEFAVILAEADENRATIVAERIREAIDACRFTHQDRKFRLSVSIGVAQYRAGLSVAEFVNCADKALYEAKAKGRNCVASVPA